MKSERSIGPKTATMSNGNNPRWINLSMEIVTLYVPVLTGKNEEYALWFCGIACSIQAFIAKPLPVWTDSGFRILDSSVVSQK